jgi:hypothetical protein
MGREHRRACGIPEEKQIQVGDIGDEAYAMPEAMDRKGLKAISIIYS